MPFYSLSVARTLAELRTHPTGLSVLEVERRQQKYGQNSLPVSGNQSSRLAIFGKQWRSPLIIILLVAGSISGFLGEKVDAGVIFFTAVLNALIGFIQEYKAGQALARLNKLIAYNATVIRAGRKIKIPSGQVVPGDILVLEAGAKIVADARVIKANELEVNEAALTGESEAVRKNTSTLGPEKALADRRNLVFQGTAVVSGSGQAVVTAIGSQTEFGAIARLVKFTAEQDSPLQQQLKKLGKVLTVVVLSISFGLFLLGSFFSDQYRTLELFETSVAVAVAAIPEGLVISLTIILAVGMQHILRHRALVRRLPSAETLGSVTVICTDKTGTLTQGAMRVVGINTWEQNWRGSDLAKWKSPNLADSPVKLCLRIGVLCNDATVADSVEEPGKSILSGDSTETALLLAGQEAGLEKIALDAILPRRWEIPFSSERKFMATGHQVDHETLVYVKGAPEVVLSSCEYVQTKGGRLNLDKMMKEKLQIQQDKMGRQGWRVIALAFKETFQADQPQTNQKISGLVFAGFIALADPLRPDVKEAIARTKKAGIRTIMITGDHKRTAQTIARELGIATMESEIMDGPELEKMSVEDLQQQVNRIKVFARMEPQHKIRIVQALQANGEVVAMTGDGINDAPALKGADIGVAVGSGTDVAKDIADLVLLDDDFSHIVAAIEEGRTIYQNIKKILIFLLAGSLGEVVLIGGSIVAGLPLAILPAQILWINLIEDSFPNLALAFDRGEKENMSQPPRRRFAPLLDWPMRSLIAAISLVSSLALFGIFCYYWRSSGDINLARTIAFAGLGLGSLLYIYSIRSQHRMIWQMSLLENRYLNLAVLTGWILLLAAVYWPPLQLVLRTVPLAPQYWLILLGYGIFNVIILEGLKKIFFSKKYVR